MTTAHLAVFVDGAVSYGRGLLDGLAQINSRQIALGP